MITDPATLTYCPCCRPKDDYPVCIKCYETAPAYWRILLSRKESHDRAAEKILAHARRRAAKQVQPLTPR